MRSAILYKLSDCSGLKTPAVTGKERWREGFEGFEIENCNKDQLHKPLQWLIYSHSS